MRRAARLAAALAHGPASEVAEELLRGGGPENSPNGRARWHGGLRVLRRALELCPGELARAGAAGALSVGGAMEDQEKQHAQAPAGHLSARDDGPLLEALRYPAPRASRPARGARPVGRRAHTQF